MTRVGRNNSEVRTMQVSVWINDLVKPKRNIPPEVRGNAKWLGASLTLTLVRDIWEAGGGY